MGKLQSAMEYLMTYGWAILVIATVLGVLYQLGVFNGGTATLGATCLSTTGYLCQTPVLNTSGYLGIKFGEIGTSAITITSLGCSSNSSQPTATLSTSLQIASGGRTVLQFSCPISSSAIGTNFKGSLWITYNSSGQTGIINRFAVVTAKVSTAGNVSRILGGIGAGTSVPNYLYYMYSGSTSYSTANAQGIGAQIAGVAYPASVSPLPLCSKYSGYIYCVGGYISGPGYTNLAYYAPATSSGIGAWTAGPNYPINIGYHSCTTYNGYLYCVGGTNGVAQNKVYYSAISSSGFGAWATGNTYPIAIYPLTCVSPNGYIYCEDGTNTYYAPLYGNGAVGAWTATTPYPLSGAGYNECATTNGYIYCIGGVGSTSGVNASYYAPLSSTGIGTWTSSTPYPTNGYFNNALHGCAIAGGYFYCALNSAGTGYYYAPVSASGFGNWLTLSAIAYANVYS